MDRQELFAQDEVISQTQRGSESNGSFSSNKTPADQTVCNMTNVSKKRMFYAVVGTSETSTSRKIRCSRRLPAQIEQSLGPKSAPRVSEYRTGETYTPPSRSARSRMDIPLSFSSTSVELWENTSPLLRSRWNNSDRQRTLASLESATDSACSLGQIREADCSNSCPSSPISNSCFSTAITQQSFHILSLCRRAPGEKEGEQRPPVIQAGIARPDSHSVCSERSTAEFPNELSLDPCSYPIDEITAAIARSPGSESRIEIGRVTEISYSENNCQVLQSPATDAASSTSNISDRDVLSPVTPEHHSQANPSSHMPAIDTRRSPDIYLYSDDAFRRFVGGKYSDEVRAHRQPRIRPRDFVVPVSMFHKIVTRLHPGEKHVGLEHSTNRPQAPTRRSPSLSM